MQRVGAGGAVRGGVLWALAAVDHDQSIGGGVAAPGADGAGLGGEGEAVVGHGGQVPSWNIAVIWMCPPWSIGTHAAQPAALAGIAVEAGVVGGVGADVGVLACGVPTIAGSNQAGAG